MIDEAKIKEQGIRLIEEFSKELEKVPDTCETHYVTDLQNVTRPDGEPVAKAGYPSRFRKIVPKSEDGYVVAEKGV